MILNGLDNLLANHSALVQDRKIGIVANPASVTAKLIHILPALLDKGANVKALFGPEHGFGGEAQDMEPVATPARGPMGIDLFSLYGSTANSLAPSSDVVSELDALVVDVMDVGARYYTFVWTAVFCLEVCKKTGTQLVILDRPNPLGGEAVEGAPQEDGFLSFVGLRKIAARHGMTVGEIVSMVAKQENAADVLTVIPLKGWQRHMFFDETGLPWVAPSPNMPTLNTAIVYPGQCLLEATWCSEARGTTRPFEYFGAPGLSHERLMACLHDQTLPGVRFRPMSFKPMFQKHAGQICHGAQLHVTDRRRYLPFKTGIAIIKALRETGPELFQWRSAPYEYVNDIPAIDLLCGTDAIRKGIEADVCLEDLCAAWGDGENRFREFKSHFHLY